jgi:hypothetical protein
MGRRGGSFTERLFLVVGLLLLVISVMALTVWMVPDVPLSRSIVETLHVFRPSDEALKALAWLSGIAGSGIGAAVSLLASWHFAEMNLPQRLEDLKKANTRKHLLIRPQFLAFARNGLGPVPSDIEASRLMFVQKWLSWVHRDVHVCSQLRPTGLRRRSPFSQLQSRKRKSGRLQRISFVATSKPRDALFSTASAS